jgi:hypothetical protein
MNYSAANARDPVAPRNSKSIKKESGRKLASVMRGNALWNLITGRILSFCFEGGISR